MKKLIRQSLWHPSAATTALTYKLIVISATLLFAMGCNNVDYNEKVDEKFGYKDLKLESSFGEIQSQVNGLLQDPNRPELYLITDSTFYVLGDSEFLGVVIEFFDNKLMSIYCLGYGHPMLEALAAQYGELEDSEILSTNFHMWGGKNATISFYRDLFYYSEYLNFGLVEDELNEYTRKLLIGQEIAWDYNLQNNNKIYGSMEISSNVLKNKWLEQSNQESKARANRAGSDL